MTIFFLFFIIIVIIFNADFIKKIINLKIENSINNIIKYIVKIKVCNSQIYIDKNFLFVIQSDIIFTKNYTNDIQIKKNAIIIFSFSIKDFLFGNIKPKKIIIKNLNINFHNNNHNILKFNILWKNLEKKAYIKYISNFIFYKKNFLELQKKYFKDIIFDNVTLTIKKYDISKILYIKFFQFMIFKDTIKSNGKLNINNNNITLDAILYNNKNKEKIINIELNNIYIPIDINNKMILYLYPNIAKKKLFNVRINGKLNVDINNINLYIYSVEEKNTKSYFAIFESFFIYDKSKQIIKNIKSKFVINILKIPFQIIINNIKDEYLFKIITNDAKISFIKNKIILPFSIQLEGKYSELKKTIFIKKYILNNKYLNFIGNGKIYKENINSNIKFLIKELKIDLSKIRNLLPFTLVKDFNYFNIKNLSININLNNKVKLFNISGSLKDIKYNFDIYYPLKHKNFNKFTLKFNKKLNNLFPNLYKYFNGCFSINIEKITELEYKIFSNLKNIYINIPIVDFKKEIGVNSIVKMNIKYKNYIKKNIEINNFELKGKNFYIFAKNIILHNGLLIHANIPQLKLNYRNNFQIMLNKKHNTYYINVKGKSFNARYLIKNLGKLKKEIFLNKNINFIGNFKKVYGAHGEYFEKVNIYYIKNSIEENFSINMYKKNNKSFSFFYSKKNNEKKININSKDLGSFLRFVNIYNKIYGGSLNLFLISIKNNIFNGNINIENFNIMNEKKLSFIILSLSKERKKTDPSYIFIDHAFAKISKTKNHIIIKKGLLKGPKIGSTFKGFIDNYSKNTQIIGTFMPGYALNNIIGHLPILGIFLGNGQERGLLGITFKIKGKINNPKIIINPISIIAPGIFRYIFEFH